MSRTPIRVQSAQFGMVPVSTAPRLASFWTLLSLCLLVAAQKPLNDTPPLRVQYYSLDTDATQNGMKATFTLFPLSTIANFGPQERLTGDIILTKTHDIAATLQGEELAYISCDPSAYTASDSANRTVEVANSRAIILFSNTSIRCTYDGTSDKPRGLTYTIINTDLSAVVLEKQLENSNGKGHGTIKLSNSMGNTSTASGSNNGYDSRSPTTAVAMIILYSITGIITALFLCIIVVGAIRAHRHPERYGPRNMLGRPRQSRARGIARAMLETIPIVKFGEKEDDKTGQQTGDVELAVSQENRHAEDQAPTIEVHRPSTDQPEQPNLQNNSTISSTEGAKSPVDEQSNARPHNGDEEPEAVTTIAATGERLEGDANTEANADNGLACSVCTDDFTKGQDVRVLPCDHKFHPECIDPWLLNVSGTCPLCRVDLRPTTSHTSSSEIATLPDDYLDVYATMANDESTAAQERRRSRTGISLYIRNTLNRRRMRDATPEERIAALRNLRSNNATDESAPQNTGNRRSNRLSARFSGVGFGNSRRASTVTQESTR